MIQSNRGFLVAEARGGATTIYLYGGIGIPDNLGYYIDAQEFIDELATIKTGLIEARMSSVGGVIDAAFRIFNAIVAHPARVVMTVDGFAHSAATIVLQAADVRRANAISQIMVHGPRAGGTMTAGEHRQAADALDSYAQTMLTAYSRHGIPESVIRGWLDDADHYFSPEEAKAVGLIDEIEAIKPVAMHETYCAVAMSAARPPFVQNSQQESRMDTDTTAPPVTADQIVAKHSATVKKATADGIRAEAKRRNEVEAVFDNFYDGDPLNPVTALRTECVNDIHCDELEARRKIMDYLAARSEDPILAREQYVMEAPPAPPPRASRHLGGGGVALQRDHQDKRRAGLETALAIRAGIITDREVIAKESGNEFRGMSLAEIMAYELRGGGYAVAGTRSAIVASYLRAMPILAAGPSHGTDNLPAVLGNIANKTAMAGFMGADETWPTWTISGTLNNYQPHTRANLALLDSLEQMSENDRYSFGDLGDMKQRITGYLFGKAYGLPEQALVNDDLGELVRKLRGWGEAGSRTVGAYVWALVTTAGSGGYGQIMDEDSKVCFHADHSNYVASGSGAAPSETTINTGRSAMMTQTDPNGKTISVRPRYLIHGPDLFATVDKTLSSSALTQISVDGSTGAVVQQGGANSVQRMNLVPVEESRFHGSTWGYAWMMAAAGDTVEVAGVDGPVAPTVTETLMGDRPGINFIAKMPFGAAILNYRSLRLNMGK